MNISAFVSPITNTPVASIAIISPRVRGRSCSKDNLCAAYPANTSAPISNRIATNVSGGKYGSPAFAPTNVPPNNTAEAMNNPNARRALMIVHHQIVESSAYPQCLLDPYTPNVIDKKLHAPSSYPGVCIECSVK
jgi:hypothetical protein